MARGSFASAKWWPRTVAHDGGVVEERPHDLLEEERIALCLVEDPRAEALRHAVARDRLREELRALGRAQRLEVDLQVAMREVGLELLLDAPRRRLAIGAERKDEQGWGLICDLEQSREQIRRRGVAPLQVVEYEDSLAHGE